jgi:hypothetical protein
MALNLDDLNKFNAWYNSKLFPYYKDLPIYSMAVVATPKIKMTKITKVISGGQTGADTGGLEAAFWMDIPTGGFAPKGWRTENGANPLLGSKFNLVEHDSTDYKDRTKANLLLANGTIIFGKQSPGSLLTARLCMEHKKPYLWLGWPSVNPKHTPHYVREWFVKHSIVVLNIAGNRESVNKGISARTYSFLVEVFSQ